MRVSSRGVFAILAMALVLGISGLGCDDEDARDAQRGVEQAAEDEARLAEEEAQDVEDSQTAQTQQQSQATTTTKLQTTPTKQQSTTTVFQGNDLFTGAWVFEWVDPIGKDSEGTIPGKYKLVPGEDWQVGTVTVLDAGSTSEYEAIYYFEFPFLTMTFTEVLPDKSGLITIFRCELAEDNTLSGWVESEPVTIVESDDGTTRVNRSGKLERLKWDILGRMVPSQGG